MSKGLVIGLIGALLLLFVGVAGLGYMVLMRPVAAAPAPVEHKETKSEDDASHATVEFLKLKNFVTDLADKDRSRYVDVTIAVGFKDAEALATGKKLEPQIRDIILSQLRTRVAAELAGPTGKDKLAETLKEPLAKLLKDGLKAIYITDLVIQ